MCRDAVVIVPVDEDTAGTFHNDSSGVPMGRMAPIAREWECGNPLGHGMSGVQGHVRKTAVGFDVQESPRTRGSWTRTEGNHRGQNSAGVPAMSWLREGRLQHGRAKAATLDHGTSGVQGHLGKAGAGLAVQEPPRCPCRGS